MLQDRGEVLADDAVEHGVVWASDGDLDERVEAVLANLLAGGPEAVRAAKELMRERPWGQEAARIAAIREQAPQARTNYAPSWKSGQQASLSAARGIALASDHALNLR
ncbi:hypothetical protein [Sorangium atrum]|uniref:Glycosyltransferase n=1 Tax=Sorangium atrum TaxID=2995308 RepID=A0ABT5C7Q8_9BACT|nr:hypothetical protein [Sorangium aterium]MDC0681794.1 hypothetical protein [Sorangium aterium]